MFSGWFLGGRFGCASGYDQGRRRAVDTGGSIAMSLANCRRSRTLSRINDHIAGVTPAGHLALKCRSRLSAGVHPIFSATDNSRPVTVVKSGWTLASEPMAGYASGDEHRRACQPAIRSGRSETSLKPIDAETAPSVIAGVRLGRSCRSPFSVLPDLSVWSAEQVLNCGILVRRWLTHLVYQCVHRG